MAKKPFVHVDITDMVQRPAGFAKKRKVVMHETVSHDEAGIRDIVGVAKFLGRIGYGIHAIIDQEGKLGQSKFNSAIYYHAKGDNESSYGIELISYLPTAGYTRWERFKIWLSRERQLHKAARLLVWLNDKEGIPLRFSEGRGAGITSHWNISQAYGISGGHWDCWPKHQGGHFPIKRLIKLAKGYKAGTILYKPVKSLRLGTST